MAGRKKRKGLRSQKFEEDIAEISRMADSKAEQNIEDLGASAMPTPAPQPVDELVNIMKSFLDGQQRREEGLLAELRELKAALPAPQTPPQVPLRRLVSAPTPSETASSPRLGLPTPGGTRVVLGPGQIETHMPEVSSFNHHEMGGAANSEPEGGARPEWRHFSDPKIPPYQVGEDIENYLLRFERIAKTWRWPESEWACRLVPLLSGKALEAYTAMDEEEAHSYTHLKGALLTKFDISPETYRQRFRATTCPPEKRQQRLIIGSKGFIDAGTWVKEHELEDGLTAAKLALQYQNAHRGFSRFSSSSYRQAPPPGLSRPDSGQNTRGTHNTTTSQSAPGKTLICYYCQQSGHKASVCPMRRAKLTGACYAPRPENELEGTKSTQKTEKLVTVNGQQAVALLDSGSFTSLIKRSLVPVSNIDYSTKTDVICVHGDCHVYPKAEVSLELDGQLFLLTVAVVDNLPKDLILGTDFPLLMDLLQGAENDFGGQVMENVACPVITRSQARTTGLQPLPDLDGSLCEGGTKGPRKSKRQRRFEKGLMVTEHNTKGLTVDGLWEVPADIGNLQRQDASLKCLFEKVVECPNPALQSKEQFVLENDVLYACNDGRKRLVVPSCCRQLVLHLAHTVPWAGHLGRHKTFLRISTRFFWPGMYTDTQAYCNTCPTCQITTSPRKSERALLQPLPVITVPFRRIAMDIVGPLPRSGRGHQYILVLCDYATRFPEAFPLRTITAPSVLRALVQLFSRVGIPEEILTDQGTNFTSRLLQLFHKQLGISAIKTTPYHPQTDGLVERFNQTLKKMLRKFVDDSGRDWDRWLPFLLFAYREAPQASTGFSPFELLYGWDVQGPLDLLKTTWTSPETKASDRGVVQFVLQMRDRLDQYREEVAENLREAQKKQKLWYDKQARSRSFEPGQKVLLLLPSSNSKLLAKWQGPYVITRRMGPVTYEILHPEKKKVKQTYHINLLKEWKEPAAATASLLVQPVQVEEEVDPDVAIVTEVESSPDVTHLAANLVTELRQLFSEMPSLFSAKPGRTFVIEHTIRLKDRNPFRQRPYRIPQKLVEQLKQEIEAMLQLGVIEPSNSEWCSPVVIVYKKDGTLRICIDFRKLNAVSEFDAYPMPRIDELLERIGSARYITTLDLCKGYWQVPLDPSSRPYTAFRTPAGLFQFTVMPFGLHGAPATFQRLMDKVLEGCEECSAAYLDDVVIYSRTWEEHLTHLRKVLGKIQKAGLTLNIKKCEWAKEEVRYLGYQLGRGEVRPQIDKVEAIRNCPRPRTKKEVRSFLGLTGWYRRFVPQFATIATPLTALTAKNQKNPVNWTEECEAAFQTLKEFLCSAPVLRSPDFTKRFLVQVDASAVGVGAVLAQGNSGEERPILYLSRKLLPREAKYSVVEKEGLAIKWALESLRYYLLGREFDLETDHRALTWINSMKDHNGRLTRWYLSLQPFKFTVRHRKGTTNVVADYLSRLPYFGNLGERKDSVTK
ncbi:hypothetical protein WMY93_006968 [Mugilogobius chulae]|uniref:Gypsy retrotransposon integrase-like protein 1 n=1 Tax=Mugilogobius chulae TaxID=88201 RepID=A0AAW0Q105_9GOBI